MAEKTDLPIKGLKFKINPHERLIQRFSLQVRLLSVLSIHYFAISSLHHPGFLVMPAS